MFKKFKKNQAGQTLIETVVAIFILVMGIVAALGLAIYSFSSSGNTLKQIVGIGLAREGVEAVKNMRDTNWLKLGLSPGLENDCYDYSNNSHTAACYKCWLDNTSWSGHDDTDGFAINPASSPSCPPANDSEAGVKSYSLTLNPDSKDKLWSLTEVTNGRFGLNRDVSIGNINSNWQGFYVPETGQPDGASEYYREIILETDNVAPFNHLTDGPGPKLKITSRVWWADRKCPRVSSWPGAGRCSVELETYLTNWKNY